MKKKISIVLVMVLAAVSLFAVPNNRNAAATVNLIRNTVITNADLNSQRCSVPAKSRLSTSLT